jgi:hypothetical protein
MRSAKLWLLLTIALFAAWIGFLAFQAYNLRREEEAGGGQPIVLSRPQFLVADLVVIAEVGPDKPAEARIKEVRWARRGDAKQWEGYTIHLDNLPRSRGLDGPGEYIVPLSNVREPFRVTVPPPSPGFPFDEDAPRVYRHNPFTEEQLAQLLTELKKE